MILTVGQAVVDWPPDLLFAVKRVAENLFRKTEPSITSEDLDKV